MSLLYFVCFVLTVKWHETPRDCEVARSLPVAVSVQLCLATRWTCQCCSFFEFFKRLLVYLKHSCLKYKTSLWSFPRSSDRIIREYQQCLQREPVLMACCARLLAQGIAELPNGVKMFLEPDHVSPTLDFLTPKLLTKKVSQMLK